MNTSQTNPRLRTGLLVLGAAIMTVAMLPRLAAQDTGIQSADATRYGVTEYLTDKFFMAGYSVHQGQVHMWEGSSREYQVYDLASGQRVSTAQSNIPMKSNGFGDPFGHYDAPSGIFYVGTYDNSGSGLYSYNTHTGTWSSLGVFDSLYGAATYQGKVYASGLNAVWSGGFGQNNQIALYDMTGQGNHDVLIQTEGNSAGVAVDKHGNVYYADYNFSSSTLYMWTAAQIESVRADFEHGGTGGGASDIYLTYGDAQVLTHLPGGANGINVDEGGNVFVAVNGSESGVVMWNESLGQGAEDHFEYIATSVAGSYGWFGHIEVEGDFLKGGKLYSTAMFGLAEITYLGASVPEPATWALIMSAAVGVGAMLVRRRK